MLHADLGRVLDLLRGAAEHLGKASGGHGAGRSDLALAADLGAGDGRVLLEEHADRAGGQQEADHSVLVGARHEVDVVVQDGRDDAGGAVRRGGDHPATRRVLLVHGHRVERDPLHGERLRVALGAQLAGRVRRPAADLQAARQDALACHTA